MPERACVRVYDSVCEFVNLKREFMRVRSLSLIRDRVSVQLQATVACTLPTRVRRIAAQQPPLSPSNLRNRHGQGHVAACRATEQRCQVRAERDPQHVHVLYRCAHHTRILQSTIANRHACKHHWSDEGANGWFDSSTTMPCSGSIWSVATVDRASASVGSCSVPP